MYLRQLSILASLLATIISATAFQSPVDFRNGRSTKLTSSVLEDLSTVGENMRSGSSTTELPTVLQEMVNERRNYEMNLGRAMDVLRKDYPHMLHKTPGEFSQSRK